MEHHLEYNCGGQGCDLVLKYPSVGPHLVMLETKSWVGLIEDMAKISTPGFKCRVVPEAAQNSPEWARGFHQVLALDSAGPKLHHVFYQYFPYIINIPVIGSPAGGAITV